MKTILVVEDDSHLRELLSYNLDCQGYEVLECHNGKDAAALLTEKGRQIDLVVLDLGLPGLDGFSVANHIKSDPVLKTIPVLVCTGQPPNSIMTAVQNGANDFIQKPFPVQNILVRINVLLNEDVSTTAVQS
ncbi:MAG: response regulator [Chloroflexota bacterium]